MPVIGITGGIASGKSTVTKVLVDQLRQNQSGKVKSFSADECSHELLENNPAVRSAIEQSFGKAVLNTESTVDRERLRKIVFADAAQRKMLEAILHPKIRETWLAESKQFCSRVQYFVAEIPLLYETDCSSYFDCIVVVEADVQIQFERLSSKRGWSLETARRVIDAQMPAEEKRKRADILITNNHTEKLLHRQIELAAKALLMRYA